MQYNYLIVTDSRFISYAVAEVKERLGITGRLKTMALGRGIYLAQMDGEPAVLLPKLRLLTFSQCVLPVVDSMDRKGNSEELEAMVRKCVTKGEPFRIEVVSLGAKRGESAKDTEVRLGQSLEKAGFTVSLKGPKRVVYIIVGEGITVAASAVASEMEDIIVDHFRLENQNRDTLNRAEVKLKEAFSIFGLDGMKVGSCLDVGASPGGWTNFLLKRGARVVAIDRGLLDYDRLATKDFKVIEDLDGYTEEHALLHIRENISDEDRLPMKEGSFDLLAIDMNEEFLQCAKVANSLAQFVRHGGFLIMTLKLPNISDAGKLYMAGEALSANYKVERIKKLHHNRMELTLLASRL